MSIVRCSHCGTANRAGSNFCNGCGTDLRESGQIAPIEPRPAPPPEPEPSPPEPPPVPRRPGRGPSRRSQSEPPPEAAPPTPELPDDLGDQPWLRLEFAGSDEEPADADEIDAGEVRLITGIQGLLTPIRIATNIADDAPAAPGRVQPPTETPAAADLRLIRGLMAEPPTLVNYQVHTPLRRARSLRIAWLFALVGLAVGLPALLGLAGPRGEPFAWPGVEQAYLAIQDVTPNDLVVVYWAYDPTTAGELDLVTEPILRHLLQRRARLAVVTLTPGAIGSAERLIAQLRAAQGTDNLAAAAELGRPITFSFLPGGSSVLPWVARAPDQALLENPLLVGSAQRARFADPPALVVTVAAQAEDVQHWLEQVQPLARTPVVAVTSAAADPILRPYLDSGQLRGLVSGFDGATTYRRRLDPFAAPESAPALLRQIVLQNWGHLALLAAIALGNLAALLSRENGA